MGVADKNLVVAQLDDLVGEALSTRGVPERVNFATGVLLGAEDFAAEQLYTRGRIGRALAALFGHGTIAGLRVSCPANRNPLEVRVSPGLALDRLGRLIEIRRTQCIHVEDWLKQRSAPAADPKEHQAVTDSVREETPGRKQLVFDVFVRFVVCPHGKTPAFAAGPFNATDYVVASRWADAFELTLLLAHATDVTTTSKGTLAKPEQRASDLEAMWVATRGITDPAEREAAHRRWSVESALDAWPEPSQALPNALPKLVEHAKDTDWDKVLLARVAVPVQQVTSDAFPGIDTAALAAIAAQPSLPLPDRGEPKWRDLADNGLRPIVYAPYSWRGAL